MPKLIPISKTCGGTTPGKMREMFEQREGEKNDHTRDVVLYHGGSSGGHNTKESV